MSSNEWKNVRLGDVADIQTGPFGSQLHQEDYVLDGTPIITVEHLGENQIIHENLPMVSDFDKDRLKKYVLKDGDIVFSRVGSVDRRALVKKEEDGWLFSGRCLRVRPISRTLNNRFLSYYFGLNAFKKYIRAIAVGSTMPSLNTTILSDIEIPLPPLSTQHRIAEVLSALDDKIELNRQTNATLEAITQAIFKEWFVDFNFPGATGEMVESELGMIPKGWRVGKLGEISVQRNERINASTETELMPYVPIDVISSRSLFLNNSKSGLEGKTSLIKFYQGDILFGAMRPYFHKVCIAPFDGTTRTTAFVFYPHLGIDYSYLVMVLNQQSTIEYASKHSTGSTIPYVQWTNSFAEMSILLPTDKVREKFNALIQPILSSISPKFFENRSLSQIRDSLLPKLMNGEIEV